MHLIFSGFMAHDPVPDRNQRFSENNSLDGQDSGRDTHTSGIVCIRRRAMTPNPIIDYEQEYKVEPRRAVTPTPKHYIYDSEDEDAKRNNKGDYSHCRQASYLNAVEFEDPKHLPNGNELGYQGKWQPVQVQPSINQTAKVNTNVTQEDWPPPPSPNTLHAHENQQITNDKKHEDWTLSGSSMYKRNNMPLQNFSKTRYNETVKELCNKAAEIQRGESFKKGKDQVRSDVVRSDVVRHQSTEPASSGGVYGNDVVNQTCYGSTYTGNDNSLKRTQSVEGRLNTGRVQDTAGQYSNTSQMTRAHSNTPFDYNNCMPQVPQRQGNGLNTVNNNNADTKASLSQCHNKNQNVHDDYDDSTYINPKAVGSLLQYQQKLHRQISNNSAKSVSSVGSNGRSDSGRCSEGRKKQIQKKDKQLKDLKVEIPDNSSDNSHQDSGYRSESSGGDRGSNSSSASNFSGDSPAINGLVQGLPKPEQIKMMFGVQNWDGRMAEQTAAFASQRFHTKSGPPKSHRPEGQQGGHKTAFSKQTQKSNILSSTILKYLCNPFIMCKCY